MESKDGNDGPQKEYDIQYNVHFSNSEDYSNSDSSGSAESDSYQDDTYCYRKSNQSEAKQIIGEYQDGFLEDLDLKIHKTVSFAQPSLPKFELNNFDNYSPILENNLMKDDEVKNIINQSQDEVLSSLPESESIHQFSENQSFDQDDEDLGFCMGGDGTNLLLESESEILPENKGGHHCFSFDDKTFKDQSCLKKISQSEEDKQFICKEKGCGKKFLDNSKLRRHQLVHSGEKPYSCNVCGKRFSLDFNLRTHLRTHTGERPYVCDFSGCGKRFTQSSNLTAHLKTHYAQSSSGKESYHSSRRSDSKNFPIVFSQANDSVDESVDSSKRPDKIFKVSKVKKENLILLRNKIPKVFWIQKYKPSVQVRDNCSQNTSSVSSDTPIRKVYGDVFKIERFREKRKRFASRPIEKSKIPERI